MNRTILEVKDLKKYFPVTRGLVFDKVIGMVKAVDGVSFDLASGETLGLVGESGCGKSTIARLIMGLIEPTEGRIIFKGSPVNRLKGSKMKAYCRDVHLVFQNTSGALNPRWTVEKIIAEPLSIHRLGKGESGREKIDSLLEAVGLSRKMKDNYPHQLSGGQRQRVVIARALAVQPKVIIWDEALSGLDVSLQSQILHLIKDIQATYNMGYIFITHDLGVAGFLCDRLAVMYLGRVMEMAPARDLYDEPMHPYTKGLLSSVPQPVVGWQKNKQVIPGETPGFHNFPKGCPFNTRCGEAREICREVVPSLIEIKKGRYVACHRVKGAIKVY